MATNQYIDNLDLEVDDHLQNDALTDCGPDSEVLEHELGANLFIRNANRLKKAKQLRSRNLWAVVLSIIGLVAFVLIVGKIRHAYKSKSEFYTRSHELGLMVLCRSSRCPSRARILSRFRLQKGHNKIWTVYGARK